VERRCYRKRWNRTPKEEQTMAGPRRLIEPHKGDRRYVRRNARGQFSQVDDVGRSLAQDRRRAAKTRAKKGYGDRGDR
jgi:hypothetical protein